MDGGEKRAIRSVIVFQYLSNHVLIQLGASCVILYKSAGIGIQFSTVLSNEQEKRNISSACTLVF